MQGETNVLAVFFLTTLIMGMTYWKNDSDRREYRSTQRDTLRIATLSTTNPTQTSLELNPGPRTETESTNRLNHGMAAIISVLYHKIVARNMLS